MSCGLYRASAAPVGRAGTPDDFSYSSDVVQDTKNRLRQLESEAEVGLFSCFDTHHYVIRPVHFVGSWKFHQSEGDGIFRSRWNEQDGWQWSFTLTSFRTCHIATLSSSLSLPSSSVTPSVFHFMLKTHQCHTSVLTVDCFYHTPDWLHTLGLFTCFCSSVCCCCCFLLVSPSHLHFKYLHKFCMCQCVYQIWFFFHLNSLLSYRLGRHTESQQWLVDLSIMTMCSRVFSLMAVSMLHTAAITVTSVNHCVHVAVHLWLSLCSILPLSRLLLSITVCVCGCAEFGEKLPRFSVSCHTPRSCNRTGDLSTWEVKASCTDAERANIQSW